MSAQMITVNTREAKNIVRMATKTRMPCLLLGSPGIGKTEIVKQVAEEENEGFLTFEAPSLDPTDVRGVLIPTSDNKSCFTRSAILPEVEKHGEKGVLLIDELSSGLPSVQVALHPLFHQNERRLGSDKLPDNWVPIATGNYASDDAGARNLLSALSDRVCVMNIKEDYKIWKEDYAIPKNIHPVVIGFLNYRTDLFSTFDRRNRGVKGKAFATPRSHTAVSIVLHHADKCKFSQPELLAIIAGWVGDGVAIEYVAHQQLYQELPNPDDVFKGKNVVIDKNKPSILYSFCAAIVSRLNTTEISIKKAIDRMLEYSLTIEAEFGGMMIRDAYVLHRNNILKSKHWPEVSKRYFVN